MQKFLRNATIQLFTISIVFLIAGCAQKSAPAIDIANMDTTVKPGENFFQYVNGNFNKKLVIPEDKTSYNAMNMLREKTDADVHLLLEEVAKITGAEKGSNTQKISDFYYTGMNAEKIEADGIKPLQSEFDLIDNISSMEDFQDVVARFHTYGLDPLFNGGLELDLMNSTIYKYYLQQAGLGLPDRDYYTKADERSAEIRNEYLIHIAKMFLLLGEDGFETANAANLVMNIETQLAEASKTLLELRDLGSWYNLMDIATLNKNAPNFDWQRYFNNISDKDFGEVIVVSPKFIEKVSELMETVSLADWKVYLKWNLINRSAEYLNEAFVMQDYKFYSEFLSGSEKIQDRWKRVTQTTNNLVGQPLGQLYAERYFPEESKRKMVELVGNLKVALNSRIEKLEWMGEATKKNALEKLEKMRVKVGYPDKWDDYSKLEVERDSYILNVRRANQFHYYKDQERFGKPVDADEWGMDPQTVNAGYHPLKNDITFPAAILQSPFFDVNADDPVNYGSIGVVIGHEMTHGFDDQGRHFDKDGNMVDWWTKEDSEEFNKRAQLIIDQYNEFTAFDTVHVNGELTIGENIADFGGLTIALEAYRLSLKGKDTPADIDGYTDVQRFFIGHAQIWRGKIRDKALLRKVQEDVHPWGEYRVNGALFNIPEFYESFDISPEDALYRTPEQRPIIW
ncbi:MAG: M13 family metallopeptidase [Bacteroidetes bacterium]|nr:M13 family metallopeptidase [Bacteroidota bacterium]